MKKLVFGVGVNDADYNISAIVNGKKQDCPFYRKWTGMMERCYSSKWHEKHPTYKDCTVCDDWISFSWFKCWMENQDWQGKQLDKDILIQGNKIYSPGTCLFVESNINSLFINCKESSGLYPLGVSLCKRSNKFIANITRFGKKHYIGLFDTADEASYEYLKEKRKHINKIAEQQIEPLRTALLNYKII